jgi:topoisomerase-4 subunit A
LLTDTAYPRFRVTFGGDDAVRPDMEIDAEDFIAVKGFKAKGKRVTTWAVDKIEELEPIRMPEPETTDENDGDKDGEPENLDPDAGKSQQQIIDEMTGQLSLFNDDDQNNK